MQKKMEGNPSHEYYLPSAMRCNLTQLASQSPPWRPMEELQQVLTNCLRKIGCFLFFCAHISYFSHRGFISNYGSYFLTIG